MGIATRLLVFGLFLLVSQAREAQAISVDGEDYSKFLSVTTDGSFGYWLVMNKYYTNDGLSNEPIDVTSVLYSDPALGNPSIDQVYAMGTTATTYGAVNSGVVQLYGRNGELLLSADLIPDGTMDVTKRIGKAGEIGVAGLYSITGGLFASNDFLGSTIYIDFVFQEITLLVSTDIHAQNGIFNFYRKDGAPTDVPEPATCALLFTGFAAAARIRRRPV